MSKISVFDERQINHIDGWSIYVTDAGTDGCGFNLGLREGTTEVGRPIWMDEEMAEKLAEALMYFVNKSKQAGNNS
jgi:hypothetical protein